MTDTARLERVISESGYKKSYIAKVIGLTPATLSRKIRNSAEFKASEMEGLCNLLGITDPRVKNAIFFAKG